MTETLPKTLTFEEFVQWLPENTGKRYELHDEAVKQLLEDILTVLAVVHERNIIHRDIKPANLMRRHKL
jgi:serine/threonine protein kinase